VPLKARISTNVAASKVASKVSREFAKCIDPCRLSHGGPFTVIAFPGRRGDSNSIVDTTAITKALGQIESMNQIIAVAHDFTSEARNKLDHMNAIMFYLSDFGWTDERWSFIRDKVSR
jgi:hypothetical protein